jgi:TolA-binding protein
VLSASVGCATGSGVLFWQKPETPPPPPPLDTMVLRGDKLMPESPVTDAAANELASAHELYRNGEYARAEKLYHKVADNTKNSAQLAEEARYYEAESLRRQRHYPKAADTYNRMLNDFPRGVYREQAVQHMFEIANYWLDDTRKDMKEYKEVKEGKRKHVWPWPICHWERTKPFLDEEGRATEKLEQVNLNSITINNEALACQSLFMLGSVKFFREDYKEADFYFNQIVDKHPNSPYAPKALELAIIAKHMSTGGSDYDGRKCAEARELVQVARRNYAELAVEKRDFLEKQIAGITAQQADKDYKIAEFYRRTRHPGAAYFYYEIVRRRYPHTPYFDKATERMNELQNKMERQQRRKGGELPPDPSHSAGPPEQAPAPKKLPPAPDVIHPEQGPAPRAVPQAPPPGALPAPAPQAAPPSLSTPPPSANGPELPVPGPAQLPQAPPPQ